MPARLIDRVRTESWHCADQRIHDIVRKFPPPLANVVIDDVADSILASTWDLSGLPLVLPFPSLWLEALGDRTDGIQAMAGWLVKEVPDGFQIACFGATRHSPVRLAPGYAWVKATTDGAIQDRLIYLPDDLGEKHRINESISVSSFLAIVAIGLMNCRNVTTIKDRPAPEKLAKKFRKRTGQPMATVSRIVLPNNVRYASTAGEAVEHAMPLHPVRAHPKTYTEDKPLLGKHVGTYIWGFQVRGSSEYGTRQHEYHLRDPKGPDGHD